MREKGTSIREASTRYGVPRSTFHDSLKERYASHEVGHPTAVSAVMNEDPSSVFYDEIELLSVPFSVQNRGRYHFEKSIDVMYKNLIVTTCLL